MITIQKSKTENGHSIQGDFWDFDRLYFAVMKFTGNHGLDDQCPFPGYYDACENLLGLCYELRHSWQGDRELVETYNGMQDDWFEANQDNWYESDEFFSEDDAAKRTFPSRFDRNNYPNTTTSNTYFSFTIPTTELALYTLILHELLEMEQYATKPVTMDEYTDDIFRPEIDAARLKLFMLKAKKSLHGYLGDDKFTNLMKTFNSKKPFFSNCDLYGINALISDFSQSDKIDSNDVYNILSQALEM